MATLNPTVLLVNGEDDVQELLGSHLRAWGLQVEEARTGREGLAKAKVVKPATALVDLVLPDMDGLDVLRRFRAEAVGIPVIMLSPCQQPRTVVTVMRLGAWDFLTKPVDLNQMRQAVRGAMACLPEAPRGWQTAEGLAEAPGWDEGLWIGEKMHRISTLVSQLADTDTAVLIRGETGVGKDLVARALHRRSRRRAGPWAKVNCAALPAELVESELFGYERGAFTGAYRRKPGRFEEADGGTIFLDEVGEMPLSTQGKLLQVLQDGEFSPLGGSRTVRVGVRVVASTNQDLERAMELRAFRKDLYYRLNVVRICIPPLRERREEIPVLTGYLLEKFSRQYTLRDVTGISPGLMRHLVAYDWPGNIRELENVVKRVVVLGSEAGVLEDLTGCPAPASPAGEPRLASTSLKEVSRQAAMSAERDLIRRVLDEVRWNRTEAARRLAISYKALLYKIAAYGLGAKV